jgi:GNAT superfamily N-acetyltransferase
MSPRQPAVRVRNTRPEDFPGIIEMTRHVYPDAPSWTETQLASHLAVFPEGQFVAVREDGGRIVGMAAGLIVLWDDYDPHMNWRDFTDGGMFTNHDPVHGRTLYGAEVMVHPSRQRTGIGKALYRAREDLALRLGLLRIRAGARLRGYHRYAKQMNAEAYVIKVVNGRLADPTLTFQLKQGFHVIAVVSGYLHHDPESLGYAAVIEWLNPRVARPEDRDHGDPRFRRQRGPRNERPPNRNGMR